ncbi:MAG: endonuclease domain-containing protein [Pirellulales bacterium]|nr:endonuclease domain-containing protein [Pirellulales bacterium]
MPNKPQPLHPMVLDRVRTLRRKSTPPEQILWSVLRGRRLCGLKFRRQESIGQYIVDFCCRDLKLIVELDGMSHDEKTADDKKRDEWLRKEGYQVFRVTNWDVNEDLEAVARGICREAGVSYDG